MNIVHVFKDFYPPLAAGITCYMHDVAEWCVQQGHQVEVHVAGVKLASRETLPNGVVVHRHKEWGRVLSSPLSPAHIGRTRHSGGDVLHVHMPNPSGEVAAFLNINRVPIVATFHAQLVRQQLLEPLYGPFRRAFLRRASAVLVSSESMSRAEELAEVEGKVSVVPFGVSPRFSTVAQVPVSTTQRLGVLFVGRLVYYKGVEVLLQALGQLPDVDLTVVGDGPMRAQLEQMAGDLGVTDRVQFRGLITDDELRRAYASHHVFVLPSLSRAEAFGLSMIEAMANGLPVISTELHTGTSWVNMDGLSGLVVAPGDVSALVGAISRLRSTELRTFLARGARSRAVGVFSFERHCSRLMEAYEKAATDRG